jgi:4-hydroxybenzoate polyprenyltransferase
VIRKVLTVLEMIKVQHSVFALPWAVVGAFYAAGGVPPPGTLLWILAAMVSARSAAMAFNRIADAPLDAENPRTRERAIPAGKLTSGFAFGFTLAMAALFVVSAWRLNDLCLKLSPAVLAVLLGYSFTKRFTALCHAVLGLSLGLAPVGAWIAVAPQKYAHPFPYLLGAAVLFWIAGADILYACEDLEFDRRKGLRSIPAALGLPAALSVARLCHLAAVGALLGAGFAAGLGPWWFGTVTAVAALLGYEHAIVKPDDLRRVNRAFFHVNAVVSGVVLAGAMLDLFAGR